MKNFPLPKLSVIIFSILVASPFNSTWAADPIVSNVSMEQLTDGSALVQIHFDVSDADGDSLTIALHLSDDSGETFDFPALNLSGDVGTGIMPGIGKTIVWDAGSYNDPLVIQNMQAKVIASDMGVQFNAHSPRHVAITDATALEWDDPSIIEKFSRADLCIVMGHHLWTGGYAASINAIQQMKALNPDIVVVAYVSVKSAQLSGVNQDPSSYWYRWYYETLPYVVLTTEGEIAQDWPGNQIINILNPDCRSAMIEIIMDMQNNSLNVFDGVMWDYFNHAIWVSPNVENVGDPDMDGDGIGHMDDADEKAAYRAAQVDLVTAARDSLGEDFIQIFNGQRAYYDSTFASLADGAFYELFPTLFFPDPDMAHALDPDYSSSLFNVRSWFRTQNGGPFLVLSSVWNTKYVDNNGIATQIITGDKFRAISLLADTYAAWSTAPDGDPIPVYNWTSQDISLGQPLGPPTFEGPFIRRDFQYGKVEIEMTSGRYPDPFDYRIWELGTLVSELAIPYHTP